MMNINSGLNADRKDTVSSKEQRVVYFGFSLQWNSKKGKMRKLDLTFLKCERQRERKRKREIEREEREREREREREMCTAGDRVFSTCVSLLLLSPSMFISFALYVCLLLSRPPFRPPSSSLSTSFSFSLFLSLNLHLSCLVFYLCQDWSTLHLHVLKCSLLLFLEQ